MSVSKFIDALTNELITLDSEKHSFSKNQPLDGHEIVHCERLFFPGCSFLSYSLELVDVLYKTLIESDVVDGISLQCCGKILLYNEENTEQTKIFRLKMIDSLKKLGVKEIVLACPNCYDEFKRFLGNDLETSKINIKIVAEELLALDMFVSQEALDKIGPFSIHDPCPDRKYGRFADSVRKIMKAGDLHEMDHIRKESTCCGSSIRAAGKEERARDVAQSRASECKNTDGEALVAACMSCCYLLGSSQSDIPVYNYLELLFDKRIDWVHAPDHLTYNFMFELF